jgi:uncharacterized membrane protein
MLTELYANTVNLPSAPSVDNVTTSGVFSILTTILAVVGFLLIFYVIFVTIQAFAKGDIGKAFKRIIGGGLVIILCFNPSLVVRAVDVGRVIIDNVLVTFDSTVDTGNQNNNTNSTP